MKGVSKSFIFFLIKSASLILITMVICYVISPLFVPKWNTVDDNFVGTNIKGYYAENDNTIDALYIGNSSVFCGVAPEVIREKYGIVGYDISFGGIKTWTEYYLLKCALKTQSPKVVAIDIEAAFEGDENNESKIRKAFDHIEMSDTKLEALFSHAYNFEPKELFSYIMPIFRYHDRWQELSKDDFNLAYYNPISEFKGYDFYDKTIPYEGDLNYYKINNKKYGSKISDKSKEYLNKIVELCRDNGIKLLFMTIPCTETWSELKHKEMEKFCSKNNVYFFDMNTPENQKLIGIDWSKHTCDGGVHLNFEGAKRTSCELGNIIKKIK